MTAKSKTDADHLDQLLDDALAGTFPASDPVGSLTAEKRRLGDDIIQPAPPQPRTMKARQPPEG